MKLLENKFLTLVSVIGVADCFIHPRQENIPQPLHAMVDPHSMIHHVTDASQHNPHLESLVSTMLTTGVAHGHSDPWFGAPDPYLAAGKSIAPPGFTGLPVPSDLSPVGEFFSKRGWPIMDGTMIAPESILPGFSQTGGILPAREILPPIDTPEVFAAQVEWSANFMNVALKLPLAALAYVLVEFFFLRSGVDMYKSEIESESATALWADTLATTFVRLVAMSVIAIATLTIFG